MELTQGEKDRLAALRALKVQRNLTPAEQNELDALKVKEQK